MCETDNNTTLETQSAKLHTSYDGRTFTCGRSWPTERLYQQSRTWEKKEVGQAEKRVGNLTGEIVKPLTNFTGCLISYKKPCTKSPQISGDSSVVEHLTAYHPGLLAYLLLLITVPYITHRTLTPAISLASAPGSLRTAPKTTGGKNHSLQCLFI